MQKYKVIHPLKHNNKDHQPGEIIELSDKQAEPLVALKVVIKTKTVEPKKAKEK